MTYTIVHCHICRFYPGSGATHVPHEEEEDAAQYAAARNKEFLKDFPNNIEPEVYNFGVSLPTPDDMPGQNRTHWRDVWRFKALPALLQFKPDLILISSGFDGHRKDTINCGYFGLIEEDYEWITAQLVAVANSCCSGRIVSALEGGYQIQGGPVSAFGRSVGAHVRALLYGSRTTFPKWSTEDAKQESEFEEQLLIERERRKCLIMEQKSLLHDKNPQEAPKDNDMTCNNSHLTALQLLSYHAHT